MAILRDISVTRPVGQAIDRVRLILFQPFDLTKWFVIGFTAWLAYLGQRGGSVPNFNYGVHDHGGLNSFRDFIEHAKAYISENLYWLLPVTIGVVVLGFALGVLMTWLSSRGRFMFLHCVALNRAEVRLPWNYYGREGDRLFFFRLVVGLIGAVPMVAMIVGMFLLVLGMADGGAPAAGGIAGMILLVLAMIAVAAVFWLIGKLTQDFVVPIMYLRRVNALEGWGILLRLIREDIGNFVLYLLFQIVLAIAIGVLVVAAILLTCCIAGCIAAIPYVGTVLMLPIFMFSRAYSAYFLAQYGSEFDVFGSEPQQPQF